MTTTMTTLTIDQAEKLIFSYCIDEPSVTAEALAKIELPLVEDTGSNWIQIVDDLGMAQDDIDAILYS